MSGWQFLTPPLQFVRTMPSANDVVSRYYYYYFYHSEYYRRIHSVKMVVRDWVRNARPTGLLLPHSAQCWLSRMARCFGTNRIRLDDKNESLNTYIYIYIQKLNAILSHLSVCCCWTRTYTYIVHRSIVLAMILPHATAFVRRVCFSHVLSWIISASAMIVLYPFIRLLQIIIIFSSPHSVGKSECIRWIWPCMIRSSRTHSGSNVE